MRVGLREYRQNQEEKENVMEMNDVRRTREQMGASVKKAGDKEVEEKQ